MKNPFTIVKLLALLYCFVFLLASCRKEPEPKSLQRPENIHWLLTRAYLEYGDYPPMNDYKAQEHYFKYNDFNKPAVHTQRRGRFADGQEGQSSRIDSFYYDGMQRMTSAVTEIRSETFTDLFWKFKKEISYDAAGQKTLALKYLQDTATKQYTLSDSIVYVYQDSTIFKYIHHVGPQLRSARTMMAQAGTDTLFYVYDRRDNLVRYGEGNREGRTLGGYDSIPNAYLYLGLDGLELEPRGSSDWPIAYPFDPIISAPKFSKNNCRQPQTTITYGSADSMVAHITRDNGHDYDRQTFEYTPAN